MAKLDRVAADGPVANRAQGRVEALVVALEARR
jgi:hypothetical protein